MLVPPIVQCPNCGLRFDSNFYGDDFNASNFSSIGNVSTCPRCNGVAQLETGLFEITGGRVTARSVVSDTLRAVRDISPDQVRGLQSIFTNFQAGNIDRQETVDAVETQAPAMAAVAEFAVNWNLINTVLAILAIYLTIAGQRSDDEWQSEVKSILASNQAVQQELLHVSKLELEEARRANEIAARAKPPPVVTQGNRSQRRRSEAVERKAQRVAQRASAQTETCPPEDTEPTP